MNTVYVLGHAEDGALVQLLERAGLFTQPAENADAALEMLGALCADAFVVDVGNGEVGGERLIERLSEGGRVARCADRRNRGASGTVPALGAVPVDHRGRSGLGAQ